MTMKIKLLRPLWNKKKGDVLEVPEPNGIWAVNKGFAEIIPETIKPIEAKVVTEYDTKVIEPEYKVTIEGSKLKAVLENANKKIGRPRKS